MLKKDKRLLILASILTLLPILAGLILWDKLPDQIATHWGMNGEANGWSSKPFAVFGLPAILLLVYWICLFAIQADPKRKNINPKLFQLIVWSIPVISILCSASIYANALGVDIRIDMILTLILGIVFTIIGNYLPKCKQSYTMGIKLPWTLHDEENWNRTHRLAGRVWVIGGIAMLLSTPLQQPVIILVIAAAMVLIPTVYSYLYYKKSKD